MTPLYFNGCFGWLHPANGARGVILCPALGLEELCTHRFLRQLATQLSGAGLPTLRFDYRGTGDSLGDDLDPHRVAEWRASIRAAVDWLRRETGVSEVVLVGFRAGALLAVDVAAELGDIARLVLIGAPPSGKAYLREQSALSILIANAASDLSREATHGDIALEVGGFPVTTQTAEAIRKLDSANLTCRPAAQVLLLNRPNAPGEERLRTQLRELGSEVTQEVLPGYAEMQWNSSLATLPDSAFDGLTAWLTRDVPSGAARSPAIFEEALVTDEWREVPVRFGEQKSLFGMLCSPNERKKSHLILFLNHGSNHHIGWARNFVRLARRFAARGVSSLRVDVAGLGDSPARAGASENQLYFSGSQPDVRAALDWADQAGYKRVTVLGHCAGAHLGFNTAITEKRVRDLIMVNLPRFFWNPGDSLAVAMRSGFRSTDWYMSQMTNTGVWLRVVRGDVNASGIAQTLVKRLRQRISRTLNDLGERFSSRDDEHGRVQRWFRQLSERGTRVLLLYGAEDGGLDEIALHAGPRASKLRHLKNLRLRVLDNTDHNITSTSAFERYAEILEEHLTRPA
jgi:pimeloyl-ACP methyl ester carboxylesterase